MTQDLVDNQPGDDLGTVAGDAGLADVIARNVHEDFYCVELVKKGVLYIHGKLPVSLNI